MQNNQFELQERLPTLIKEFDYPELSIQLHKKNLFILHYKKNVQITEDLMKKVNDKLFDMVSHQKFRVLVEAEFGVVVTEDARVYSLREDQIINKIAHAAVANSLGKVVFANLLIKIKQNDVPFKMFKTQNSAIRWLDQFIA
jgi:hypothetical protein